MNLNEFLDHLNRGLPVAGGSETHLFMHEVSHETMRLTTELNNAYHTPEEEESAMDGAIKGLTGWIDCFEKTRLKGVVRGIGVGDVGDIEGNPALREAYKLGKTL